MHLSVVWTSPGFPQRLSSILGIEDDEAVHSVLDVVYAKASYTVIQRVMHIHPTVSELIPTVLGDVEPLE